MNKNNKLPHELKVLLQGPIENLNLYNWRSLEVNQTTNCALYLKITNQLEKLKQLFDILLNIDQEYTVFCVIVKYPELIEQLQLTHVGVILRVLSEHPRNCKYISDTQWKLISDYSQEYTHIFPQLQKSAIYHNNFSYYRERQIQYLKSIFHDIILNSQYHEYIVKFIQFNIQIYQLNALLDDIEHIVSKPQYNQTKGNILKMVSYIKTTKWYTDNLISDEVGYNIEKCPVKDINAQDLRDLFE